MGLHSIKKICLGAVIVSHDGDILPFLYRISTGCNGAPAKKAPVLKGRIKLPLVVVPSGNKSNGRAFFILPLSAASIRCFTIVAIPGVLKLTAILNSARDLSLSTYKQPIA